MGEILGSDQNSKQKSDVKKDVLEKAKKAVMGLNETDDAADKKVEAIGADLDPKNEKYEEQIDTALKSLGEFVNALDEGQQTAAIKAIQKAAEDVYPTYKDLGVTADDINAWCLRAIPGADDKDNMKSVIGAMKTATDDGKVLYGDSTAISGACLALGVKYDKNIEDNNTDANVKAMQDKLNAFIDRLDTEDAKKTWDVKEIEGYKKEIQDLLASRDKKGVEKVGDKYKLISDGKLGKATTKVLEVWDKAMDEEGRSGESKTPEKKVEPEAKTEKLELHETEVGPLTFDKIVLTKETKDGKTTNTITFDVNGKAYTINDLDDKIANNLKAGNVLTDDFKDLPEFQQRVVAYELVARKMGDKKIDENEYRRIIRESLNYSADGKIENKELNEMFGSEIELSDQDLIDFKTGGKISFGLDWEGADSGAGEDDPQITLIRDNDSGAVTMSVTVRGATQDPKDYAKKLTAASNTLGSSEDNAQVLAKGEALKILTEGVPKNDSAQKDIHKVENGNTATFTLNKDVNIKDALLNLKAAHSAWVKLYDKV